VTGHAKIGQVNANYTPYYITVYVTCIFKTNLLLTSAENFMAIQIWSILLWHIKLWKVGNIFVLQVCTHWILYILHDSQTFVLVIGQLEIFYTESWCVGMDYLYIWAYPERLLRVKSCVMAQNSTDSCSSIGTMTLSTRIRACIHAHMCIITIVALHMKPSWPMLHRYEAWEFLHCWYCLDQDRTVYERYQKSGEAVLSTQSLTTSNWEERILKFEVC